VFVSGRQSRSFRSVKRSGVLKGIDLTAFLPASLSPRSIRGAASAMPKESKFDSRWLSEERANTTGYRAQSRLARRVWQPSRTILEILRHKEPHPPLSHL
jgi:hypothetical protein